MMKRPQRDRRLQFEVMESREVLSASPAVAASASPAWFHPVMGLLPPSDQQDLRRKVMLNGVLAGSYVAHTSPDAGTSFDLSGQGQLSGVVQQPQGPTFVRGRLLPSVFFGPSPATVAGNLHSLGFILRGQAGGTLTLSTSTGSLTLGLTGPLQSGSSPLPDQFDYEIEGGTGVFADATGQGTASLVLSPASTPDILEHQGRFDLHLASPLSGVQPMPAQT